MAPFLISSVHAAYTKAEMEEVLAECWDREFSVTEDAIGLTITGRKEQ